MASGLLTHSGPWTGGLKDTSVVIRASLKNEVVDAEVIVAKNESLTADRVVRPKTRDFWPGPQENYPGKVATFDLSGLEPDTQYFFQLRLNRRDDAAPPGRFRTAPWEGSAADFSFACGGCARRRLAPFYGRAYRTLAEMPNLLFFCYLGDFFYGGSKRRMIDDRLKAYDGALGGHPGDLFRTLPIAYSWDDHDFLGDSSAGGDTENENASLRTVARDAYDGFVPHYSFEGRTEGIYQSFQIGRVLFLLTDTRFFRSPQYVSDTPAKTMLGESQKLWLRRKLCEGRELDLIVWMNSVPWIAQKQDGADHWGGFTEERAELAAFIVENDIRNICMLSADAHMVAIDSGEHSGFGPRGRGGFPIFQAASLHSLPVTAKGNGRYSIGDETGGPGPGMPGRGQFGVCDIRYRDGEPIVKWTPYRALPSPGSRLEQLPAWEFRGRRTFAGF